MIVESAEINAASLYGGHSLPKELSKIRAFLSMINVFPRDAREYSFSNFIYLKERF